MKKPFFILFVLLGMILFSPIRAWAVDLRFSIAVAPESVPAGTGIHYGFQIHNADPSDEDTEVSGVNFWINFVTPVTLVSSVNLASASCDLTADGMTVMCAGFSFTDSTFFDIEVMPVDYTDLTELTAYAHVAVSGDIDTTNNLASATATLSDAPPLPEGCREEACHSAAESEGSLENCHRTICGGNFWGESAVDIRGPIREETIGEGEEQKIYQIFNIRLPTREYSSEDWDEIGYQTSGPQVLPCGVPFLVDEEEETVALDINLENLLIGNVWAEEPSLWRLWGEGDTAAIAIILDDLADRISTAIRMNDAEQVGSRGSELRIYTDITLEAILWLLHQLRPTLYPCPSYSPLDKICPGHPNALPNYNFGIYWNNDFSALGEFPSPPAGWTGSLMEINVKGDYALDQHTGDDASYYLEAVSEIAVHETVHILNHLYDANRATSFQNVDPYFYSRIRNEADLVRSYVDETTAHMASWIVMHWLRGEAPLDTRSSPSFIDALGGLDGFELIRDNPRKARILAYDPNYYTYPKVRRLFGNEVADSIISRDFWSVVSSVPFSGLVRITNTYNEYLDNKFLKAGGAQGLRRPTILDGGESSDASDLRGLDFNMPPFPSLHPPIHHDYVASPLRAGPGTPEGTIAGPPPDIGTTYSGGDSSGTQTCNGTDCSPLFTNPFDSRCVTSITADIPGSCYDQCWEANVTEGDLCSGMRNRDEIDGCIHSSGANYDTCLVSAEAHGRTGSGSGGSGDGSGDGSGGSSGESEETESTGSAASGIPWMESDFDGDGSPDFEDPDDDNDTVPDTTDPDDDNDGMEDDEDYFPGEEPFTPGSTRDECVLVDEYGNESCVSPCVCDVNNPWWCQPSPTGSAYYSCPTDDEPPADFPNGESRMNCSYTTRHLEEWVGDSLRCGTRGYCGTEWIWTVENTDLCYGTISGESLGLIQESIGGCFPYVGPVRHYTGPAGDRTWANGSNQACDIYCGCDERFTDSCYESCINPNDGFETPATCYMVGDICYCEFENYCSVDRS